MSQEEIELLQDQNEDADVGDMSQISNNNEDIDKPRQSVTKRKSTDHY